MRPSLLILACGLPLLAATAAEPAFTERESKAARKIYVAKCAKCHRFYDPKAYSEPEWRKWMDSMSRKSRLKPDQDALLNRLLDDYRAGKSPDPAKR